MILGYSEYVAFGSVYVRALLVRTLSTFFAHLSSDAPYQMLECKLPSCSTRGKTRVDESHYFHELENFM
jgi:hypothetical protein